MARKMCRPPCGVSYQHGEQDRKRSEWDSHSSQHFRRPSTGELQILAETNSRVLPYGVYFRHAACFRLGLG
jgi:hypothetical protein